jgi:transcriptional regulator with XRE-family HTH domain
MLRRFRLVAGLTQEELAEKAGLSVRTVRTAERVDGARPGAGSMRRLVDALGLSEPDRWRLEQATRAALISEAGAVRQAAILGDGSDSALPPRRWGVPAQLPADVPAFTGRSAELAELDTLLAGPGPPTPARGPRTQKEGEETESAAVVISAVSGTAGVGKTALAMHWAHRARGRFPDGQLYVNLRGYDPDLPISPADALAGFLSALGVAGHDIPLGLDDRAARYRTEITDRRILIVLDNAASVEQVRPLLPGSPSCAVLVTSRDSLAGLVAVHGAHRLDLDLLPPAEARALLRRLIGPRVDAEPAAAATLATLCARLPLALRVAAELAISRPTTPLAELIAELADQQQRLNL